MLCSEPFVKAGEAFPCGKCLACLKRRRKIWTTRLFLESQCHSDLVFVTLTYAEDTIPQDMSLQPVHMQLFLKRLRKAVSPRLVRFYGVGEYGDQSQRPHYHLILFGYPNCLRGRSMYTLERRDCCSSCDLIRDTWGYGNVMLGSATPASMGYVCSYITKNMRRTDDKRLHGRWPEFARMSLRPGIGYDALREIAETLVEYNVEHANNGDVPVGIRQGPHVKPYGRYMRRKLRLIIDGDEKAPEGSNVDEEMLALWMVAVENAPPGEIRRNYFKNLLLDAGEQRILQMSTRSEIFKKRSSL